MRPLNKDAVRFVVIHCSATAPAADIGAAEIKQWHLGKGRADIGYHVVIRRNGVVEQGRGLHFQGAHVRGHNYESVAVCLIGGAAADGVTPDANFTAAQWSSLEAVVLAILEKFPGATLRGHRDFPGVAKACPSFDVKSWWSARGTS